jgi:glucosamine-6-phosphate deaminase
MIRTHPQPIHTSLGVEQIPVSVFSSASVAAEIAELIRERSAAGEKAVLGLATGSTPQAVYDELVRLHREEGLSFANVVSFNLDEYWPMPPKSCSQLPALHGRVPLRSHRHRSGQHARARRHHPAGAHRGILRGLRAADPRAGGLDCQMLGIGRTGTSGSTSPGPGATAHAADHARQSDADGRGERLLRRVERAAAGDHDGRRHDHGREARGAHGVRRAQGADHPRAVEGEITNSVAASFCSSIPGRFVLDGAAAAELTRFKTPWLLGHAVTAGAKD